MNLRISEIELSLLDFGLRGGHGCLPGADRLDAVVIIGFAYDVSLTHLLVALEISVGETELRIRLGQLRARGGERDLERTLFDSEQQVALLNHLTVREMDLFEVAADPRAHINGIDCPELSGVLVPLHDLLVDRIGYRYRRPGRSPGAFGRLTLLGGLAAGRTALLALPPDTGGHRSREQQHHGPQHAASFAGRDGNECEVSELVM